MNFNLTKEQELVRKSLRAFTEAEVKPIAAETDRTSRGIPQVGTLRPDQ